MALAGEMILIIIIVCCSFGRAVTYTLDHTNLIVEDSSVVTGEDGSFFVTGRNDEETFGRWIITSEPLKLPWGMYELTANYDSMLYTLDNNGGNGDDQTGTIQLVSTDNKKDFVFKDLNLFDGKSSMSDRLWIRAFTGVDDLEVKVNFYGVGDLHLTSITIRELPVWRFTCILAWLLLFGAVDGMYLYFFTENGYRDKYVPAVIIGTVFFASLPLFTDFLFWGHDLDFHLARILALAEGLKNGHLIVPIQTEMINRYGYATPLFYSQLFLYLPAVLYLMAAPTQICYQVYAFSVNLATCLICYYSLKWFIKDKKLAVVGTVLYTLSAYRISNMYCRAAVGEYTAMAFFPLVVCGFVRVYTADKDKITWREYLPIVAGLTGLIQCHVLSCELSALFILLLCIIMIRKTLEPMRFLALAKAALLTLGVNFAFLVPFVQSMQMNVRVAEDTINEMQEQGTYLLQVFGIFMTSVGDSRVGMTGEMPLTIGFAFVFGMTVFLCCCAKKYKWDIKENIYMKIGTVCTGFAITCIIFSLRIFPWDSIRDISETLARVCCMIQFPWRYLAVCTVFALTASVIGFKIIGDKKGMLWRNILCGVAVSLTLINIGRFYMQYGDENGTEVAYGLTETDDCISGGEYLLSDTIEGDMRWRRIVTDERVVTVNSYDYTDGVTTFWCQNNSDSEQTIDIPLLNYDNYHAYAIEDGEEFEIRNGANNYVQLVIKPRYEGMVQVKYVFPLLWKLSYAVSFIVLAGLIAGILYDRRKRVNG